MVGPEAYTEVKYLMAHRQLRALDAVSEVAGEFAEAFGRDSGGLLRPYRTDDAEVVVVALGSVLGSLADVVDELRDEGVSVGALGVTCYRPWPVDEVRRALRGVPRVIVLNRAVAVGSAASWARTCACLPLAGRRSTTWSSAWGADPSRATSSNAWCSTSLPDGWAATR